MYGFPSHVWPDFAPLNILLRRLLPLRWRRQARADDVLQKFCRQAVSLRFSQRNRLHRPDLSSGRKHIGSPCIKKVSCKQIAVCRIKNTDMARGMSGVYGK